MIIMNWNEWMLRMESDSFIMLVNKTTNEYRNVYFKSLKDKSQLEQIIEGFDRHKNYKG